MPPILKLPKFTLPKLPQQKLILPKVMPSKLPQQKMAAVIVPVSTKINAIKINNVKNDAVIIDATKIFTTEVTGR